MRRSPPPPPSTRSRSFGSIETWCYLLAFGKWGTRDSWLTAFMDSATLRRASYRSNWLMELQAGCQRANATYQFAWSPESARVTPAVWCEALRPPVAGKPGAGPGCLYVVHDVPPRRSREFRVR